MSLYLIGQTFNCSDPGVRAALAAGDRAWIEQCALRQVERGVDALEVHAGGFDSLEKELLPWFAQIVEICSGRRLSLDSADPEVLGAAMVGRHHPPLLNSLAVDGDWPDDLLAALREGRAEVVVQLRESGGNLPEKDHLARASRALERLAKCGVGAEAAWLDPVILPWGPDLEAGQATLDGMRAIHRELGAPRQLVGLSNVSWGHSDRAGLHRIWLERLVANGLDGVILDPFEPGLVEFARRLRR